MNVFVSYFHPILTFSGMARSLPLGWSLLWSSKLVCKCYTMVEVLETDRHSSLLRFRINYDRKNLYSGDQLVAQKSFNSFIILTKIWGILELGIFTSKYHIWGIKLKPLGAEILDINNIYNSYKIALTIQKSLQEAFVKFTANIDNCKTN